MKKFIGNVNGKSFDNEKDFNDAAAEAIKSNSDNLSISSYYSYVNEDEAKEDDSCKEIEEPVNYVSKEDYVLVDQKPVALFGGKVLDYKISDELKKKLEEASNKDEIRETAVEIYNWCTDTIKSDTERVKDLQIEIERLQDELYEKENGLKELKARKNYYDSILDFVNVDHDEVADPNAVCEKKDDKDGVKNEAVAEKKNIDRFISNFDDAYNDLFSFLRHIKFF